MMQKEHLKRLIYAKYFYWLGCKSIDKNLLCSSGLAVLNFQDAAEMVLRTIAENINADVKENSSFMAIIDKIEKSPSVKNTSFKFNKPFLNQLNKSRVNFKHYGFNPYHDDAVKFKYDIEIFLNDSIKHFFKLDFIDISITDLIEHRRVQNYLRIAESKISSEEFQESIVYSAKSFYLLFYTIWGNRNHAKNRSDLRIQDRDITYKMSIMFENINREFNEIYGLISNQQKETELIMYGVNLNEYYKFMDIIPHVTMFGNAFRFEVVYAGTRGADPTYEKAQFCLRFVTDVALLVQENRYVPEPFLKRGLRTLKVIKKSSIVINPNNDDIETIRDLDIGEIIKGYYEGGDIEGYFAIVQDNQLAYVQKDSVEEINKPENDTD